MNRFLRSGCLRAIQFFFERSYQAGAVEMLLSMRKAVRGDDQETAVLGVIGCAIKVWRRENDEPLFKHAIYDVLPEEAVLHFILDGVEADKSGEFIAEALFEAQEWTLMSDIKECAKEHPRRSARLAAKRAAKA